MAKTLSVTQSMEIINEIQLSLDKGDYPKALSQREELLAGFLATVKDDRITKVQLKELAAIVSMVDDMAPRRSY